jgi:hypothetical protein
MIEVFQLILGVGGAENSIGPESRGARISASSGTMLAIVRLIGMYIATPFKSRRPLGAENLFLRHQLNIALRGRSGDGDRREAHCDMMLLRRGGLAVEE